MWQAVDVWAASAHVLDSHWRTSAADGGNIFCVQHELCFNLFSARFDGERKDRGLENLPKSKVVVYGRVWPCFQGNANVCGPILF